MREMMGAKSPWYPRVNIEKDLQNQWFPKENRLQMVDVLNRTD